MTIRRLNLTKPISDHLTALSRKHGISAPAMIALLLFDYAQRNPESAAPAKKPIPKAAAPAATAAIMKVWAEDDEPNTVSLDDDDEALTYGD